LIRKEWFLITLFLLSCTNLYSFSIPKESLEQLSNDRYWKILLHIKNSTSEIDDPSFFLTSKENFSAKNELNATISSLAENNDSIYCRYPARVEWLKSKLPQLFKDKNESSCRKLEETLQKEKPNYVTLVFPTAYINSPASMFGHTFLRIDSDLRTPLIGEAINYAAKTDETNGFVYTYKGLFGGYKGYYSALEYYEKIKEYSAMEQRDMWEYRLNLTPKEIRKMLYHLYELKGIYNDYYFFTKNCSYNLLWLLQSARESEDLTRGFKYKAIPIDTVKRVNEAGLIEDVYYRPSKRKEMKAIVKRLKNPEIIKNFTKTYNLSLLSDLNQTSSADALDLAILRLKHQRSKNKLSKKRYIKNLMKLLKIRSKLPKTKPPKIKTPQNPLLGHDSSRILFGISSANEFNIELRPAFHDMYDNESGFIQGAYIDFFSFKIFRSRFQSFDFVNVTSLSARDSFFKPLSWSAKISLQRVHAKDIYMNFAAGVGLSYDFYGMLFYMLLSPGVNIGKNTLFDISPSVGFVKNFDEVKFGFRYMSRYFTDGVSEHTTELFMTFDASESVAINLKLQDDKIGGDSTTRAVCALFYYF